MDNKTMARLLAETADLLEIDGADSFRIRSYRRAAEAAEQTTVDLVEAAKDSARLLEIDGIGKSMAAHLQTIAATGKLPLREAASNICPSSSSRCSMQSSVFRRAIASTTLPAISLAMASRASAT